MSKSITAVTHDGTFHADDVMATAILMKVYGEDIHIIRSRDPKIIESADIVYDVGGMYDHASNRFDHHMDPVPTDINGNILSSAGMIWLKFNNYVSSYHIREQVYDCLIKSIDLIDNGKADLDPTHISFSGIIFKFNKTWNSDDDIDHLFWSAVDYARITLDMIIKNIESKLLAIDYLNKQVIKDNVLILDRGVPWIDWMFDFEKDIDYVIFPDENKTSWFLQSAPVSKDSFELKKPLPETWAGKRDKAFQNIIGDDNLIFCHPARFIAGAKTKDSVLALLNHI